MFNKEYTKYWEKAVSKSIDGSVIPGLEAADFFLKKLDIGPTDIIIDVGCSYGRMHDVLSTYSKNIYGLEIEETAVLSALKKGYLDVKQRPAENTGYDENQFNLIFCWAVFEAVNHYEGLIEFNRILKKNGRILITGKSDKYPLDDSLALEAEKNAFLKGFPQRFTNLSNFLPALEKFGFSLDALFLFSNRGDFGLLKYSEASESLDFQSTEAYEYLLLGTKTSAVITKDNEISGLDSIHTKSAALLASAADFDNVESFFSSL